MSRRRCRTARCTDLSDDSVGPGSEFILVVQSDIVDHYRGAAARQFLRIRTAQSASRACHDRTLALE